MGNANCHFKSRYSDYILGADGCLLGIPLFDQRVVKINPKDNTFTPIGDEVGPGWIAGVLANNNCIYCLNILKGSCKILKIDTIRDTVVVLNVQMPESNVMYAWISGALASDGCIYFMPCNAKHILKLNPGMDSVTRVGGEFVEGSGYRYIGTVANNNGYIYGMPLLSKRIVKFDLENHTIEIIGGQIGSGLVCLGNGTFGRDGRIYVFCACHQCEVIMLKINTVKDNFSLIRSGCDHNYHFKLRHAVQGNDGCIYWQTFSDEIILKFDPDTLITASICADLDARCIEDDTLCDGSVYFVARGDQIITLNPLHEFTDKLKTDVKHHPEVLGFLLSRNDNGKNLFSEAITKYGTFNVFRAIDICIPAQIVIVDRATPAFMIAASCGNNLDMIFILLRRDVGLSPIPC